jgi:hypothetical protein
MTDTTCGSIVQLYKSIEDARTTTRFPECGGLWRTEPYKRGPRSHNLNNSSRTTESCSYAKLCTYAKEKQTMTFSWNARKSNWYNDDHCGRYQETRSYRIERIIEGSVRNTFTVLTNVQGTRRQKSCNQTEQKVRCLSATRKPSNGNRLCFATVPRQAPRVVSYKWLTSASINLNS